MAPGIHFALKPGGLLFFLRGEIKEIKKGRPVSRVLFYPVIHLGEASLLRSIDLPVWCVFRHGSGQARTYLVFQPAEFTRSLVTQTTRELLPHVFTFSRQVALHR